MLSWILMLQVMMEALPDRDTVNIRISDDQIQRTIHPHYTKRTMSSGQVIAFKNQCIL